MNIRLISKHILTVFLIISSYQSEAQDVIVKYYDADWAETAQEKAVYYAEFKKEGSNYDCRSYWVKTNNLKGRTTYPDTVMGKPIGEAVTYYRNGNVEDSVLYGNDGNAREAYHYYENKQLAARYYVPGNKQEGITEGFDETGKKIKNYIYAREAQFKGGEKDWQAYLVKNVSTGFFNTRGDAEIRVSVSVQFIIDENGSAIRPKVLKPSGISNIDRDALRVIAASPQWSPAVLYNKPIKAYRIQPFTYVLPPLKK